MRREFKIIVECKDDSTDGYIDIEDIAEKRGLKLAIPPVDEKLIGNREIAIAFAFRTMAVNMLRRCFPEYKEHGQMQAPEQHGDRIIYPGQPGHSSVTGIDPQ